MYTYHIEYALALSLGDCGEQGRYRCWLQLNCSKLFVWSILHLLSLEWCPSAWSPAVYPGYPTHTIQWYSCTQLPLYAIVYTCVQGVCTTLVVNYPYKDVYGVYVTSLPYKKTTRGIVKPMQISFQSTILGEFSEDFQWAVGGSPAPLSLRIT